MANQDFNTWLESDASSIYTRTAARVTVTRAGSGTGFFTAGSNPSIKRSLNVDLTHLCTVCQSVGASSAHKVTLWTLQKTTSPVASLKFVVKGPATYYLEEIYDGVTYTSSSYVGSLSTVYYPKIELVRTGADFGTFSVKIYSDSGRTSLLSTLSLSLHGFAYYDEFRLLDAPAGTTTAYVEDLDIGVPSLGSPAYTFPSIVWDAEDCTTYSETDPDSQITVTASRITAGASLNYGRVQLLKGVEYFTGNRVRFKTEATGNDGAGSRLCIFGITNDSGPLANWTSGLHIDWYYDGTNYQLKITDVETEYEDTSSNLTVSTVYYCEFRRHGRWAKLFIFSDSTYTTHVDTIFLHGIQDDDKWSYVYGVVTQLDNGNDPTWDLLDEAWTALGSWTESTTGGVTEISPAGQLHVHPNASCYARRQQDIGTLPSQYTLEVRQYYDALGNEASGNRVQATYRNGEHQCFWRLYTDKFGHSDTYNVLPYNYISLTTSTATWYTWRFVFDSTNNKVKVFRKPDGGSWTHIGTWRSLYVDTGNDGLIYTSDCVRAASGDVEAHEDYIKIATGLYEPPLLAHINCYIDSLTIDRVEFDKVTFLGRAITATVEHDGETYPGTGWTDNGAAGTTGEASTAWADTGTSSLHFIGKSDGTNDRCSSKTFTAGTYNIWEAACKAKIISIADGHVCHLFALKDTVTGNIAVAAAERSGSSYYWSLITYYSGAWHKTTSTHTLSLNTAYLVDLCLNDDANNPAQDALSLVVDGVIVADIQATTTVGASFFVDTAYVGYGGGAATYPTYAERYVDNFYFRKDKFLRFGGIDFAPNGDLIAGASDQSVHYPDNNAPFYLMTSSDLGDTWTLRKTIDTASKQDFSDGIVTAGSNVYAFATRARYTTSGENQSYTDVWKSTDNGLTYTKVYDADSIAQPRIRTQASKIVESGKILSSYLFIPPNIGVAGSWNKFCPYNTATDTFDAIPSAKIEDSTENFNCFPNETNMYRRPSDNNLVAMIRHDEYTGGVDTLFQTFKVSADDGANFGTATSLQLAWGNKGGRVFSAIVDNYVWFCGYHIADMDNYSASMQTFVMQCDPDTLDIIQEKRWTYVSKGQELGNGELVAGPVDPVTGNFYLYMLLHSGASLYFYRFLAKQGTTIVKTISESTQLIEGTIRRFSILRVLNETVQEVELILKRGALKRVINETISTAEGAVRYLFSAAALVKVVNDTVQIVETSKPVRGMVRIINETLQIIEDITKWIGVIVDIPDSDLAAHIVHQAANIAKAVKETTIVKIIRK